MKQTLMRNAPEALGIPSAAIERLLDALEQGGFTDMHGLMIARHGQVCAEGWWTPYAPGLRHCCHSLSKSYTATAIGIAKREGLLKLTDRVVDILAAHAPENPSAHLQAMTVRDLLVMGSGMDVTPSGYHAQWVSDFLRRPVVHAPGSFWRYDSYVTTCLSAIVTAVSGQRMVDYLTPRLFDVIGIDASNVLCRQAEDGTDIGGSGMYTTTEDNLRLVQLYMNGGVWNGVRILDEDFVREATAPQMQTRTAHARAPWIYDNCEGYGYQIWMCRPAGAFRLDGAFGQFAIAVPALDLCVSISETAYIGKDMLHSQLHLLRGEVGEDEAVHGPQAVLNAVFGILLPAVSDAPLPEDPQAAGHLAARLAALRIPVPRNAGTPAWSGAVQMTVCAGEMSMGPLYGMPHNQKAQPPVETMTLDVQGDACRITWTAGGKAQALMAGMDGTWRVGRMETEGEIVHEIACAAAWTAGGALDVHIRHIETELENTFTFTRQGGAMTISKRITLGQTAAETARCVRCRIIP